MLARKKYRHFSAWPRLSGIADNSPQLQEVQAASVPDAVCAPAHVACELLTENTCTGDHKDTLALLALCLQRKFDHRPGKTTHTRLTCEASGNHRAVWLGGGGVDNTHTHTHTHLLRWRSP